MSCPIKTSPEWREHTAIVGTDKNYMVWSMNNNNPLNLNRNGELSSTFENIKNELNVSNKINPKENFTTFALSDEEKKLNEEFMNICSL